MREGQARNLRNWNPGKRDSNLRAWLRQPHAQAARPQKGLSQVVALHQKAGVGQTAEKQDSRRIAGSEEAAGSKKTS